MQTQMITASQNTYYYMLYVITMHTTTIIHITTTAQITTATTTKVLLKLLPVQTPTGCGKKSRPLKFFVVFSVTV